MATPSVISGVMDCAEAAVAAAIDRPVATSIDFRLVISGSPNSLQPSRPMVAATVAARGRRRSCRLSMNLMPSFYAGSRPACKKMREFDGRRRASAEALGGRNDRADNAAGAVRAVPRHGHAAERAAARLHGGLAAARRHLQPRRGRVDRPPGGE